jgi:hypothetical protein
MGSPALSGLAGCWAGSVPSTSVVADERKHGLGAGIARSDAILIVDPLRPSHRYHRHSEADTGNPKPEAVVESLRRAYPHLLEQLNFRGAQLQQLRQRLLPQGVTMSLITAPKIERNDP